MSAKINQVQLALFSPGIVISNKLRLANMINEAMDDLFDGDPIILPMPEDLPPEVPRIILKSKDEKYLLQIAINCVNFFYRSQEDTVEEEFLIDELYDKWIKLQNQLFTYSKTQFHRAALVTQWIVDLSTSAAPFLSAKYLREGLPFESPYEMEIHCLTKEKVAECEVNMWVRIKSIRKLSKPEQDQFLLITIDINSLAEKTYEFDEPLLKRFLDKCTLFNNATIKAHLKELEV